MWDLTKTLRGLAGARKREARGLPPFHATPEEQAKFDNTFAEIRAAVDRRDANERNG